MDRGQAGSASASCRPPIILPSPTCERLKYSIAAVARELHAFSKEANCSLELIERVAVVRGSLAPSYTASVDETAPAHHKLNPATSTCTQDLSWAISLQLSSHRRPLLYSVKACYHIVSRQPRAARLR
jgi:hypothetical protein